MNFYDINEAIQGKDKNGGNKCLTVLSHEIFDESAQTATVFEEHVTNRANITLDYMDEYVRLNMHFDTESKDDLNYFWGILESNRIAMEQNANDAVSYIRLIVIPTEYSGKLIVQGVCPIFTNLTASAPGNSACTLSFIFDMDDVIHNENDEVDIDELAMEAEREVDAEEEYEEMLEEKKRTQEENYLRRLENAKKYRT